MRPAFRLAATAQLLTFAACAGARGDWNYAPPAPVPAPAPNVREFAQSPDAVWAALVAHAGDTFFVIDNLQKDSYFLSASYSASNPQEYIDCGIFTTTLNGRTTVVPYAAPAQNYAYIYQQQLYRVVARTTLSGKLNVLVQPAPGGGSRAKVTVRYGFVRTIPRPGPYPDDVASLTFESGNEASATEPHTMTCRPNYEMERGILDGIAAKLGAAAAGQEE